MGIAIRQGMRRRQPDQRQDMLGKIPGDLFRMAHVDLVAFADLRADGERRIERGHRLLKDHGNVPAANLLHLTLALLEQILTLEEDLAADNLARRRRDQAENRQRSHALAAAGFADDTECLTRGKDK